MAVTEWEEIGNSRDVDAQGYRSYTRTFWVKTNNPEDGGITVMSAVPIQQWVSYYSVPTESDPYALAKTASAVRSDEDNTFWTVTYQYDTRPFDFGSIANPTVGSSPPGLGASPTPPSSPSPPGSQSPAVRPWGFGFVGEQTQVVATGVDKLGTPIKASNGQPLNNIQYDRAVMYFELTVPSLTVNLNKVPLYYNAINSDTFFGFPPGTLRCTQYNPKSQFEQQWGYFWETSFRFQYKDEGHVTVVQDEGSYWLNGGQQEKNKDKWSNPIDGTVLLDGAGGKLPPGANPVPLEFLFYTGRPFQNIM
jgi:hypothetical protein